MKNDDIIAISEMAKFIDKVGPEGDVAMYWLRSLEKMAMEYFCWVGHWGGHEFGGMIYPDGELLDDCRFWINGDIAKKDGKRFMYSRFVKKDTYFTFHDNVVKLHKAEGRWVVIAARLANGKVLTLRTTGGNYLVQPLDDGKVLLTKSAEIDDDLGYSWGWTQMVTIEELKEIYYKKMKYATEIENMEDENGSEN